MDKAKTNEGWLIVFDQNRKKPWKKRHFWSTEQYKDLTIHIIRC
jgi:hypothetical protein